MTRYTADSPEVREAVAKLQAELTRDAPRIAEVLNRACAICGTDAYEGGSGPAEMHDPDDAEEAGGLVHADCGLAHGWTIS